MLTKLEDEDGEEKYNLTHVSHKNWYKNPRLNFTKSQAEQVRSDGICILIKQIHMRTKVVGLKAIWAEASDRNVWKDGDFTPAATILKANPSHLLMVLHFL